MQITLKGWQVKAAIAVAIVLFVITYAAVKDAEQQKARADTAQAKLAGGFSKSQIHATLQKFIDTSAVCTDSARRADSLSGLTASDTGTGPPQTCSHVIRMLNTYK